MFVLVLEGFTLSQAAFKLQFWFYHIGELPADVDGEWKAGTSGELLIDSRRLIDPLEVCSGVCLSSRGVPCTRSRVGVRFAAESEPELLSIAITRLRVLLLLGYLLLMRGLSESLLPLLP